MSAKRIRLHWVAVQPTPYNSFLFRSVAADPAFDLTVHFTERMLSSHPWESMRDDGFRFRYCCRTLGLDWQLLREGLLGHADFFVIAGWNEPTIMCLMNCLALAKRPFAVWTDTPKLQGSGRVWRRAFRTLWLRLVFRYCTYHLGTGKLAVQRLNELGCPQEKLLNFPFFIDLSQYCPATPSTEKQTNELVLVSSGRLINELKGYNIGLRALARARELSGVECFTYRIAGVGPDKDNLAELVRDLRLDKHVEFVGWLEPGDVAQFLQTGQVFLQPALWDPYPVAVLEAMACGLAVLVSDGCGMAFDRVSHGENGFVHPAGDVESLARHIAACLLDPAQTRRLGGAARRTAEEWPVSRAKEILKSVVSSK